MFGRIAMICLLLIPVTSTLGLAEDQAGLSSFDELRDQGLLYLRKKQSKLAYRFLTRAYGVEGGQSDFKTVYNRGVVAHDLLELEVAFEMLAAAKPLVGDSARRARDAKEFEVLLNSLYGQLKLEPAPGETNRRGRIFFESQVRIINKKKRTLFKGIRDRFRATELSIPTTVYLPHGRFTANNVPVEIAESQPVTAHIYLQIEREAVAAGGVNGWWIAGVGAATAIASTFGAYFLFADRDPETVRRLLPSVPPPPGGER
jgi:hypothetical protein